MSVSYFLQMLDKLRQRFAVSYCFGFRFCSEQAAQLGVRFQGVDMCVGDKAVERVAGFDSLDGVRKELGAPTEWERSECILSVRLNFLPLRQQLAERLA